MASIIRSTILTTASRLSRPIVIPSASFASSSRHGLDFTRPRQLPPPTNTTTTLLEPDVTSEPVTESHESPSTSNQNPEPIPTPQPSPKTIPTPSETPKLHTPQIPTPSARATGKNAKSGMRWVSETDKSNDKDKLSVPTHTLHVRSTRNNIILSFTDGLGPVFTNISGGSDKQFKNSQRSSYEAATQASIKMFEKILEYHQTTSPPGGKSRLNLRVSFNGLFGMGREAIASALSGPEGQEIRGLITRVEDRTKVKIGGTRARKPRRL
ncbi:hypothetical protein I302_108220 [Kwoniella bestiolae CBS 10118]|uniref:Ribosomal protein S11 n=1 Tax=Kwoniella bestiolae CBS 10118 TaxID=1296100 RepID=A0A1B9FWC0_9TREE|nr:hypothetical protein I302_07416 [Kwoniella bestiolae CBS 10118]OCF23065.1 hypothetical protein I302_07416 [Kwoniella bestiolae CBS 10118]